MRSEAEIREALKARLDARHITQTDVARVLGVQQPNAATIFKPGKNGKLRGIGYDEGLKLIDKFQLGDANDPWQPCEETIRLAAEAWSLSLSGPQPTETDLRLLAHAVNEVLLFAARDPSRQERPDFPGAVVAVVETSIRNYKPRPGQAA